MFQVLKVSEDKLTISITSLDSKIKIDIPTSKFNIYFTCAYCITTHCSQGMTISENITIHEFSKFDDTMKYVAISRCKSVSQLNFL